MMKRDFSWPLTYIFWLSFKSLSNKFGLSLPVYVSDPAHHIQKEPLLSESPLFVCVH